MHSLVALDLAIPARQGSCEVCGSVRELRAALREAVAERDSARAERDAIAQGCASLEAPGGAAGVFVSAGPGRSKRRVSNQWPLASLRQVGARADPAEDRVTRSVELDQDQPSGTVFAADSEPGPGTGLEASSGAAAARAAPSQALGTWLAPQRVPPGLLAGLGRRLGPRSSGDAASRTGRRARGPGARRLSARRARCFQARMEPMIIIAR